jgi:SAM-dependent methyltransferase
VPVTLDEYINKLRVGEAESHIELDKGKELAYMEAHRYRYLKVLDAIPKSPNPIKVLDIGATPFTLLIGETYPHYEISTLDLTNLMEARCKARNIHLKTCNLDEELIPFQDGYFDVVICTEVLEHVFNQPTAVLKEIRRVMRQQGLLILSVPNFARLENRTKLLFGVTPLPNPDRTMKKEWVHGHGHIHEYTMKEIVCLLEACNFAVSRKKFLQPRVRDAFKTSHGNRPLVIVYRAIMILIPPFRPTNYVECYKL